MKLVFLHGLPLDGSTWQPQLDAFPGALAPDIPGYGSRQRTGEIPLDELESVVDGSHVVGHSFGAAVAVELALRHPAAIRSLTLVNPLLLGRSSQVAAWSTCVALAKAGDLEGARTAWLDCPLFDGARDQVRAAMAAYQGAHWSGTAHTIFRITDPAPRLPELTMPALLITASRDQPSFRAMVREYQAALPHAELHELEAGHMVPCEKPERFNTLLRAFLDRL